MQPHGKDLVQQSLGHLIDNSSLLAWGLFLSIGFLYFLFIEINQSARLQQVGLDCPEQPMGRSLGSGHSHIPKRGVPNCH